MKKVLIYCLAILGSAISSWAHAQESESKRSLTFSGTVLSKYVFSALFVATDEPVLQMSASYDLTKACSADVFGSHGFATSIGREVDLGFSCRFDVTDTVKTEFTASRYIFFGDANDITAIEGKVTFGAVDVTASSYIVDGSAEDAQRIELGYTTQPVEKLSLRALVLYEQGFDTYDIVVGGIEASYPLNEQWSLSISGYAPISKDRSDTREAQFVVGLSFKF